MLAIKYTITMGGGVAAIVALLTFALCIDGKYFGCFVRVFGVPKDTHSHT